MAIKAPTRQMAIRIAVLVLASLCILGAWGYMTWRQAQDDKADIAAARVEHRRQTAARAVAVLPPATQAAWAAYVEKRLATRLQRQGDVVWVATSQNAMPDGVAYVSINTPYVVRCAGNFMSGAKVQFGEGDAAPTAVIYGNTADDDDDKPPALGVDPDSLAAAQLSENLCRRIAGYMQRVMSK